MSQVNGGGIWPWWTDFKKQGNIIILIMFSLLSFSQHI